MAMELTIRFDYGSIVPWVRRIDRGIRATAGPETIRLTTEIELRGENFHTCADFTVRAGERIPFTLTWYPSHLSCAGSPRGAEESAGDGSLVAGVVRALPLRG